MNQVGAYLRLSKEDGDKETSDSIENQRSLIDNFVKKLEDAVMIDYFIDDGYSGLSFDRPGFNRMIQAIAKGSINTVITKDMSRLGRDRLETGHYIEKVFPLSKVRYIAILDNYDSLTGSNTDMVPFKGLLDEMYAKDISKKVKGAFDAKRYNGEFIGAFAPYGYQKDPGNKNKLIPDEEAAHVVKRIFAMFLNGTSKLRIAKILNNENIPCPSVYKNNNGMNYVNANRLKQTCYWTYTTVSRILENQLYIGDMVQKKEETIFKANGKKVSHEKNKWIIVAGTHEPVIEKDDFENVQLLNHSRTRRMKGWDNVSKYAGILKCADCGRAMSKTRFKNVVYYKCGSYKQLGKDYCSAHSIREDILDGIILDTIRNEAKAALDQPAIARLLNMADKDTTHNYGQEMVALENQLIKIRRYKKKIYEDFTDGLLNNDEFIFYKKEYEEDEKSIKEKIHLLQESRYNLEEEIEKHNAYVKRFIQYVDIENLTREILIALIDSFFIHENKTIAIKFKFENPCG